MNATARFRIIVPNKSMDHKNEICSYVRRACAAVTEHIEDYVPDGVYTDCPGEVVIHLPLDGAASIEVNTETYIPGAE